MNRNARIQTWATLVAALALPLLYIGGTNDLTVLSVLGICVFAGSLLICPALRFVRHAPVRVAKTSAASPPSVAAAQR